MPMDLNKIKLDAAKLRGGVWWAVEYQADGTLQGRALRGDPGDVPALCVRPAGVEYQRAMEEAQKPFLAEIRERRLAPEDQRAIVAQAFAKALWIDARNITIGGELLAYTPERGARMLADPAWQSLLDFLERAAGDRAAALAGEEAKALGN